MFHSTKKGDIGRPVLEKTSESEVRASSIRDVAFRGQTRDAL